MVGTADKLHVGLKTYRQTLQLADHEVILTFDDGPNPSTTQQVLQALRDECVQATFFLIGNNAAAHPALVREEVADGHTIGTHSWSHPERTLRGMSSDEAAIEEITRGISAVHAAAHGAANVPAPFFRFPGFADSPASIAWLDEHHIGVFGCDLWASDWKTMSPEAELKLIMERLEAQRRGIILFHDARAQTAAMLPKFLRELKAKGYRVVHMVPADGPPPPLEHAPSGWHSETEDVIARVMPKLRRAAK
jgi:peptidoglycan/xylan/chitin deacetylase (PgdA/CDA1 family)